MEDQEDDLIWKDKSGSLAIRFQGELDDGRPGFSELLATASRIQVQHMLPDRWGVRLRRLEKS
jgi:hypothetical protein